MYEIKSREQLSDEEKQICDHANVFYSDVYSAYIDATGDKALYVSNGKNILFLQKQKLPFVTRIFLPSEIASTEIMDFDREQETLDSMIGAIKEKCHPIYVTSTSSALFHSFPTNSFRIPFGSHVLRLSSEEDVWNGFHSKHRNMIRRGIKDGLTTRFGNEVANDFLYLDEITWKRSNMKGTDHKDFLKELQEMKGSYLLSVCYRDGRPQAEAMVTYNKQRAYYMYGASENRPSTGASEYLQWEIVRKLLETGIAEYSFVGCRIGEDLQSKYHGIQEFKKRFGGKLDEGYMFKAITNKKAYDFYIKMYSLLKHGNFPHGAIEEEIAKWQSINEYDVREIAYFGQ